MAGYPEKAEKLNYTLHWAVDMLEKKGIDKWFIAYVTLLGVVREGSCIHGDDDVERNQVAAHISLVAELQRIMLFAHSWSIKH